MIQRKQSYESEAARAFGSSTLHEAAGRSGALPSAIRPIESGLRICGPAFPVRCKPGSNLALHHAIYAAQPGDVLVVDTGSGIEFGYWGEVMTVAAMQRGLAGLVIFGGVRDIEQLRGSGFPIFAAAISLRGTHKESDGAWIRGNIMIGDVEIAHGDLVHGDDDGVVVLKSQLVPAVIAAAQERERAESVILDRLRAGDTTLDIYALPALDAAPLAAVKPKRRSIDVSGLSHGHLPIPAASRIGPVVATGGVRGIDTRTDTLPADGDAQVKLMFANLRTIVEAAGGEIDDILKVTIWISDDDLRGRVNSEWIEIFPDRNSRPSRHILNYDLSRGMLVQCEALVYIENRSERI
jgi:4-hydroxy-4-methyl-2-oxoglutarate aldolase